MATPRRIFVPTYEGTVVAFDRSSRTAVWSRETGESIQCPPTIHDYQIRCWDYETPIEITRFVTMQNHYSLVYREGEREMLPFCEREGVGVIPWSPLARGYLARPHGAVEPTRTESDEYLDQFRASYVDGGGEEINERVEELAGHYDVTMAQVALAWLFSKEAVAQ